MKTRRLMGVAGVLVLGAVGAGLWRTSVLQRHHTQMRQCAESLLANGRASEALGLAHQANQEPLVQQLELKALVALNATARLAALWRMHPERFVQEEQASVLAARGLVQARDPKAADQLLEQWKSKTKHPDWWLYLKADGLLAQRKRDDARRLLSRANLSGAEGAGRLLRLALLCDPKTAAGREAAWSYLEQASKLDPKNADVAAFRAELLEAAGRIRQAETGYLAAWQLAPRNSGHCEQVASFYQRQGNFSRLTEALKVGMEICPTDSLRVKTLFWQRMTTPNPAPSADPPGGAQPLGRYLAQLPTERFFDREGFEALADVQAYTERYPEVLYLELSQALHEGQVGRAVELLGRASRQAQWNPALERALALLLKEHGHSATMPTSSASVGPRHPYLLALEKPSADPATSRLRKSPHGFAAAYLAAGWWEAALRLAQPATADLSEFPEWYAYGLAQALRENRGAEPALRFVEAQKTSSPTLQLTRAELLRNLGRADEARVLLAKLASNPSPVGYRAACLKAIDELEQHQPSAARATLSRRRDVAESETGKALLRATQLVPGGAS